MNRYSLLVAALLLLVSQWTFAAYRIGVSIARVDDNFMTYVRTGLEAAAKQQDVQIQFEDAQGDVVRQLNQVEGFLNQKVDAVIVLPVDTAATANMTRAAVAARTSSSVQPAPGRSSASRKPTSTSTRGDRNLPARTGTPATSSISSSRCP